MIRAALLCLALALALPAAARKLCQPSGADRLTPLARRKARYSARWRA